MARVGVFTGVGRASAQLASRVPLAVAAALLLCACGPGQGLQQVVKDRYRVSVLTLNIAGALPEYSSNPEIPLAWRERYSRIAAGFITQSLAPDIIALQEATARKEWVLSRDPDEHESLHYLISKLQVAIGIRYRIAYLGAADTNHPGLVQGQAVLYNPRRLKNATTAPPSEVQPGNSKPQLVGVQPRRSYPCDSPAEEFKESCSTALVCIGRRCSPTSMGPNSSRQDSFDSRSSPMRKASSTSTTSISTPRYSDPSRPPLR
jgi:hypothetical protein